MFGLAPDAPAMRSNGEVRHLYGKLQQLLLKVGALPSARAVHEQRFLRSHVPTGTDFPAALSQYQPPVPRP